MVIAATAASPIPGQVQSLKEIAVRLQTEGVPRIDLSGRTYFSEGHERLESSDEILASSPSMNMIDWLPFWLIAGGFEPLAAWGVGATCLLLSMGALAALRKQIPGENL